MSNRKRYIEQHGEIPDSFEVHHIIPNRLGGDDSILNLVAVSKEDHKKLHLALYLIFGDYRDLCAYSMIGNNFTEAHAISSSIGGTIGGNIVKERKIGICTTDESLRKAWASLGGKAAQATLRELKIGAYHDPELKKEISSKGGKNGAFTMPHIQSELGKRGGIKNKGSIWVTNGIKNKKFTVALQSEMTLAEFLSRNEGWYRGYTSIKRENV